MATSDFITIPLTKGYSATVDSIDADLLSSNWRVLLSACTYARAHFDYDPKTQKTKNKLMHRLILERVLNRPLVTGEFVDHINGDGLDNRRSNLRLATKADNCRNAKLRKDNKAGLKGVSLDNGRWRARIRVNTKEIYLGSYSTKEAAHEAYKVAAKLYFGEFARVE